MIIVRCLFLMLFATCFYGSNALAADFDAPLASHNFFTPELKPSPDAFKVAKSTWLPDSFDDLGLSGRHNTKYDFNKNDCSSYPLKTCPSNGKCTKCPVGAGYKLDSCNTGYTKTGDTCRKKVEFCVENATTFKNNIPTDYVCSKITTNSLCNSSTQANCDKCYSSCYKINCSGYPLDCQTISKTALHIATTEICPNCKNSTTSKCAKAYCKITECENGYKVNAAGTACIEKDDTCPNGYYKSCETGTQGTPQYTEKGTACYQCKPKTTENMKVVVNFDKSCPAGLSFKMTPKGGSAVTCSSSQCYEYDTGNYPYAPDGIHSNETEAIVTVGTQINLSSIPSAVSDIKSVSQKQTYSVSGTTYSFNVNDKATVIAGVGQDTASGLGAYDFWTLQCNSGLAMLGDILYSDMTTGRPENHAASGKTAIGVVFNADKKLALALENEKKSWYDQDNISVPGIYESWDHPKNTYNGKQYTKTIVDYCKANGKNCLAAKYSYLFTTKGTHIGDWYLPSISELNLIYNNKEMLNNTLSVIKGMQITDDKHWASEKCSSVSPYYRDFSKTENEYNGIGIAANKIKYNVRPIINYSDVNGADKPIADITPALPYLYSDFSTSTNIDKNKIIIGIVFNKDKKLAISTEYKEAVWATENFDIPTINNYTSTNDAKADWNGKANTGNAINYCKTNNKSCPAVSYANTYKTAGTKSGDWYLPATGELNDLFAHKDEIDINLNLLRSTNVPQTYYWSSTEIKCPSCTIGQSVQSSPSTIVSVTKDTSWTTAVPIINYGTITPNQNTSRNAAQCIASDCELETNCYNRGLKTSYCNEKYSQCQSCCGSTPDKNCYHVY